MSRFEAKPLLDGEWRVRDWYEGDWVPGIFCSGPDAKQSALMAARALNRAALRAEEIGLPVECGFNFGGSSGVEVTVHPRPNPNNAEAVVPPKRMTEEQVSQAAARIKQRGIWIDLLRAFVENDIPHLVMAGHKFSPDDVNTLRPEIIQMLMNRINEKHQQLIELGVNPGPLPESYIKYLEDNAQ